MRTALIMLMALPLLAANGDVNRSADGSMQRFSGRVFDIAGAKQISNAIVTVTTPSGYVASVVTNSDGQFNFASLPAGEYDFRVTAHGFAIYERQFTVSSNGGVRELDIRMLVPVDKQTVSLSDLRKRESAQAGPIDRESLSSASGPGASGRRGY